METAIAALQQNRPAGDDLDAVGVFLHGRDHIDLAAADSRGRYCVVAQNVFAVVVAGKAEVEAFKISLGYAPLPGEKGMAHAGIGEQLRRGEPGYPFLLVFNKVGHGRNQLLCCAGLSNSLYFGSFIVRQSGGCFGTGRWRLM